MLVRMHRSSVLAAVLIAAGCSEPPPETAGETARPVKSILVAAPQGKGVRRFPGRVDSANKAELSFRVNGKLERLFVTEGVPVERGQLLAQLDQADYVLAVTDRQAVWDRADKDFARARDLVEKGAISRRDYDEIEANFKTASAALDAAKLDLEYTELRAPFAGNVAERFIEQFEEITFNQPVFSLVDTQSLQVEIDLPESLVLLLRRQADEQTRQQAPVWATFDTASDRRFDLAFKEITNRADADTQTFKVTLSLDAPDDILVLPGMSASVTVDFSGALNETSVYYVPVSAVSGDPQLDPRVWRIDETTMTVHAQAVELGQLAGSSVEVVSGVTEGERIVTAGAAFLAEGMRVTLMEDREQAVPRADDV